MDPLEHQVGHKLPRAVAQTSVQDLNLVNDQKLVTEKAEYWILQIWDYCSFDNCNFNRSSIHLHNPGLRSLRRRLVLRNNDRDVDLLVAVSA